LTTQQQEGSIVDCLVGGECRGEDGRTEFDVGVNQYHGAAVAAFVSSELGVSDVDLSNKRLVSIALDVDYTCELTA
jgi:hypothetical protein